jgi:RHS repeat-associated protein
VVSDKDAAFDAVNRLQGVTDLAKPDTDLSRTTSFDWDRNGNQLAKTEGSGGAAVTTSFVYDIRNKLAEARQGASILARYQYDAEGRLLKKIGEDGIRQYVYDEASRFVEYDQAGTRVARFSYGSDRLISMEHRTEGARFYHLDGLGSVAALTDTTGAVAARIHADAWGNFRIPSELDASANRFAFTGHVFERELGLYNARARFLDPEFGRFISQDSYLGQIDEPPSLHRYSYAHNNPTFFVDPTGHIARQILDQSINRSTDQASNWFIAGVTAFFKEASYQTLDVISFGALHRQDKLVDQNLAGEISDTEYHSKTAWNVALSSGQAAMTLGTGGTLGATRGAAVAWGAAGGIAGQGVSDIGEIYATETKTLDQVRATDYLLAGAMGAVGGYAGYKARGITQAEKTGVIAEQGQSVRPEAPAPAARAASTGDVNVQPAIKPAGQGGPSSATAHPGRLAAESSDISKESIMRALRRSGTLEGAATAKLLKRGKVTLELTDQLPPGVVGRNPWTKGPNPRASKIAQVSTTGNRTPLEAAGATAHEARHVLQDLTPRTYGRFHEFDPYRWQIKIDRRFGASLRRDYGVADTEAAIRMHIDAQYSTIPYRARDIVMPNPNPRLP